MQLLASLPLTQCYGPLVSALLLGLVVLKTASMAPMRSLECLVALSAFAAIVLHVLC